MLQGGEVVGQLIDGAAVKVVGGLVKKKEVRLLQHRTRDGQSLCNRRRVPSPSSP